MHDTAATSHSHRAPRPALPVTARARQRQLVSSLRHSRLQWLIAPTRSRRGAAVSLGLALEVVFLAVVGLAGVHHDVHHDILGVTGAGAVSIAVAVAVVSGPWAGLSAALVAGVAFFGFVTGFGASVSLLGTIATTLLWSASAVVAGVVAETLRTRVADREVRLAGARDEAVAMQTAFEHVLSVTPALHTSGTVAETARAICAEATVTFSRCQASVVTRHSTGMHIIAASPVSAIEARTMLDLVEASVARDLGSTSAVTFLEPAGVARAHDQAEENQTVVALASVELGDAGRGALVLSLATANGRPDDATRLIVQRFVDHCATALSQASRREAEADAARLHLRLEQSLLPRLDISDPGLRVAMRYSPGEHRMSIGGDFMDAVIVKGSLWAVIGDVTGHGPDAAALGATLRAAWRALVLRGTDLLPLAETLESVLDQERATPDDLATMCLVHIHSDRRAATFLNLGHPRPLFACDGHRPVELAPPAALPLGVGLEARDAAWVTTLALEGRWSLLLYTDGLVEGYDPTGGRFGIERLIGLVDTRMRTKTDGGQLLGTVLQGAEAANGGRLPDDVAMLLVSDFSPL
jgi:serine phosphatase RsbU (regulator of sigma subunit)